MRLLLDTPAFLWWLAGDEALSAAAKSAIADEGAGVFVSAASAWEITTKHRLGKLSGVAAIVADLEGGSLTRDSSDCRSAFDMARSREPCRVRTATRSTGC